MMLQVIKIKKPKTAAGKNFFSDPVRLPPIAAVIILAAGIIFFRGDVGLLGNFVIISMLVGVVPYLAAAYLKHERIRLAEEQFPVFMRDLAEAQKAGSNLPDALRNASKTDYGRLSAEIKKVSDQLSWGIPLQEVLDRFSARMKGSDIITRSVRIINEAYSSGGNISDTMESIATDVSMIRETKKERTAVMAQHITMVYIIYFVFIAIVLSLSNTLIPMLNLNLGVASGLSLSGGGGFSDPCSSCSAGNYMCVSCSSFSTLSLIFSLGTGAISYYRALFLSMVIVQGIFTGLVAGQIGSNSAVAGAKHSFIMTAIGFGVFMIVLRLGIA